MTAHTVTLHVELTADNPQVLDGLANIIAENAMGTASVFGIDALCVAHKGRCESETCK